MRKRDLIDALDNVLRLARHKAEALPEHTRLHRRAEADIATVTSFHNFLRGEANKDEVQPVAGRRVVLDDDPTEEPIPLPTDQHKPKAERRREIDEAMGLSMSPTRETSNYLVQSGLADQFARVGSTTEDAARAIMRMGMTSARYEQVLGAAEASGVSLQDVLNRALEDFRASNDDAGVEYYTNCGQCEGTGQTSDMGYREECPVCDGSGLIIDEERTREHNDGRPR